MNCQKYQKVSKHPFDTEVSKVPPVGVATTYDTSPQAEVSKPCGCPICAKAVSEVFTITMEPLPAPGMAPAIVRVRHAIKALRRAYLMRVTSIKANQEPTEHKDCE
jgi:hypothetical protein